MKKILGITIVVLCFLAIYTQTCSARIEDTYGYTLKGDPYNSMQVKQAKDPFIGNIVNEAYYLRDKDFFGEFLDGEWKINGKLNYGAENMEKVESSVKEGNYEYAKQELLNYYKAKSYKKDTVSSNIDIITADLLTKNFMYNGRSGFTPQSYMYVDGTKKYVSADVTQAVKQYSSSRSELTFMVLAVEKDKYTASFDSKEGENSPYIKAVVSGKEVKIYPSDDTYINAAGNASKNFGSDSDLRACESAPDTSNLVNIYTKRIYLKFNTQELKNASSASLYMYGYNMTVPDITDKKELIVFYSDDSAWNEESATYNSVAPQLMYSYDQSDSWGWDKPSGSGSRYAEELLRFDTWFDKLVKAYNYTGDEKYAYTALRQIMDFINVRGDEPTHLVTLDVAVRTQCLPKLFMQLLDSKYMTPEIFTAFMKYMYVEANASKNFTRSGNWGTSETLGLFITSIYFKEFTDSDAWIQRVHDRYEELLGDIVNSDYSCTELSLGYVDYTISTLTGAKDVADELKTDISPYSEKTMADLEKMGLYMYYMSMPGQHDNQMGDGYSYTGNYRGRLSYLGKWFNNDELLYAGSGGTTGSAPNKTSMLFPVGKKAVMRSDWTDNALYLYTNVDGGIGNHGHADDNGIILYAYGKYLLTDQLYGTYSQSATHSWLVSSIAHNTVTMNGKNQYFSSGSAKQGTIDKWETNNGYDFIKETTSNVPDAKSYTRSILSVKDKFYIVNDYIVPKNTASNKYVQAWHFLPSANIRIDSSDKSTQTNMSGANIKVIPINISEINRASIEPGYFSSGQGSVQSSNYTEYEKNMAGNTVFNTILLPQKSLKNSSVTYSMLSDGSDITAYELNVEGEKYIYMQRHNGSGSISAGGYETDASMILMGFDNANNINYIAANDISYIKNNNETILSSKNKLSSVSVLMDDSCVISGSDITSGLLNYNAFSLYAPGINDVTVNGQSVSAKKVGDNIIFSNFSHSLLYDVSFMNYEYDTEISLSELAKYGISCDTSSSIYSVRKFNNEKSVYRDALRFGTRSVSSVQEKTDIMSLIFANDSINNPKPFSEGKYLFESEFAIQNKDNGEIRLSFLDGDNVFARVCFKKTDSGSYVHSGKAYAVNKDGEVCGNEQEIKISADNSENTAGALFYLKAEIDFNNQKMSIWLVPRAYGASDYEKIPASEEYLLVSDMDISASEFSGISFDITKNRYENSVWLSNLSVTETLGIDIDITNVFSSKYPTAEVTINNPDTEQFTADFIVAQYDETGRLISVDLKDISTLEEKHSRLVNIDINNGTNWIGAYVWDKNLKPYAYKKAWRNG
jgi:hypothetical protein